MKIIKIIMATTADELKNERKELGDYVRTLNDHYHNKGIYFRLDCLTDIEAEEEKEKELCESEFFYIIFSDDADDSIVKKFDVALKHFKEKDSPRIYTYFQKLPDSADATGRLRSFMEKLDKEIGHYYSMFMNIDSIKLNMLLEITRTQALRDTLVVKDSKALVDGTEMLSLENIPIFKNNELFQNLSFERKRLQKEQAQLVLEGEGKRDNFNLREKIAITTEKIKKINEQLQQIEKNILSICSTIVARNSSGKPLTWREKNASRCLDKGDYEGAIFILRDASREYELEQAEALIAAGLEQIIGYINENRLLIQTLMSKGIDADSLTEIYERYEKSIKLSEKYKIETVVVYEYAVFLWEQKNYEKAIEVAYWLEDHYEKEESIEEKQKGDLCHLLGNLFSTTNQFSAAKNMYLKAIKVREILLKNNLPTYINDLAASYSELGVLLRNEGYYQEAKEYLQQAIQYREYLADSNLITYGGFLLNDYKRFADLNTHIANYKMAVEYYGKYYDKGLEIRHTINTKEESEDWYKEYNFSEGISKYECKTNSFNHPFVLQQRKDDMDYIEEHFAQVNPVAREDKLAEFYISYANMLRVLKQYRRAKEYYNKALLLLKGLVTRNREVYQVALANCYGNFGVLWWQMHNYKESYEMFVHSIRIFEIIANIKPVVYNNILVENYNNFSRLLMDMQRFNNAGDYLTRAFSFLKDIDNQNPLVEQNNIADIHFNCGYLYMLQNNIKKAEERFEQAICIQKKLAQIEPWAFEAKLANSYNILGELHFIAKQFDKAEEEYKQAKHIYERLYQDEVEHFGNFMIYSNGLASVCRNIGFLLLNWNRKEEALIEYKKAIMLWEEVIEISMPYGLDKELVFDIKGIAKYDQGLKMLLMQTKRFDILYKDTKYMRELLTFNDSEDDTRKNLEIPYHILLDRIKTKIWNENRTYKNDIAESTLRIGLATGDTWSINHLANQLLDGEGNYEKCNDNDKIAFELFKRAIDKGNITAKHNLGWMYKNGRGCEKDYEKARKLFEEAELENSYAYLGEMYEKGLGVKIDYEKALKYYQKGAVHGSTFAQNRLENIAGYDAESLYKLGMCYYYGRDGFNKHYNESIKWLQLAAEQHHAAAQFALACFYEEGLGVKPDMKEALKWLRLSLKRDNVEAQYKMGMYFYNGQGVVKNLDEAVAWFQKASKQGSQKADAMLNKIKNMSFWEKIKWKLT